MCKYIPLIVEHKSQKYIICTGCNYYMFPNNSYIAVIILLDVDNYHTKILLTVASNAVSCFISYFRIIFKEMQVSYRFSYGIEIKRLSMKTTNHEIFISVFI